MIAVRVGVPVLQAKWQCRQGKGLTEVCGVVQQQLLRHPGRGVQQWCSDYGERFRVPGAGRGPGAVELAFGAPAACSRTAASIK